MALSLFKQKQTLVAKIVAARDEDSWSSPTWCGRLLFQGGTQAEMHATGECRDQFKSLELGVCFSFDVTRHCVKPYAQASKSGIQNKHCLRMAFRAGNLSRTVSGFSSEVVADREFLELEHLDQLAEDAVFNLSGEVHSIGPAPSASASLKRRQLSIRCGDYVAEVNLLGQQTSLAFGVGDRVAMFGMRKSVYAGVASIESTRLAWTLVNPSWLTVKAAEGPERKALRLSVLDPVSVSVLRASNGQQAMAVEATMNALDNALFEESIWVSDSKLRIGVSLRDDTGTVWASLWGEQLCPLIGKNLDELALMWTGCEDSEEHRAAFLGVLNVLTASPKIYTLRPRTWQESIQWNIVAVAERSVAAA